MTLRRISLVSGIKTGRREAYDAEEMLACAECKIESTGKARGWRALLGLEDDDTETVVVLCPECAEREFGDERHGDTYLGVDWD